MKWLPKQKSLKARCNILLVPTSFLDSSAALYYNNVRLHLQSFTVQIVIW